MFINRKYFNPFCSRLQIFLIKLYIALFNLGRKKKFFCLPHWKAGYNIFHPRVQDVWSNFKIMNYWTDFCAKHFELEKVKCLDGHEIYYPKVYSLGKGIGFKVRFKTIKW